MKLKYIVIALLMVLGTVYPAYARMSVGVVGGGVAAGVAYPGFSFDESQDFEDALGGSWSEADAGTPYLDPADSTAEYRGTYGMSLAGTGTADSMVLLSLGDGQANFTTGFWYYTGTYAAWEYRTIVWVKNDAQGNLVRLYEGHEGTGGVIALWWSLNTNRIVTLSHATWYWVEFNFVQNGTSSLAVYNTTGTQVGDTLTNATPDYIAQDIGWGSSGNTTSTDTYFDEIYVNWTTHPFPLGPPSGS